jgi:ATP-dependent Clp protease ATP-binding subunit ClpB
MLIEKFTLKAQGALERASRLAVKHGHRYVTPIHLLLGCLEQKESPAPKLLLSGKTNLKKLLSQLKKLLEGVEKAPSGTQGTPINRDLERIFIIAEEWAGQLKNRYIAINHLFLGLLDNKAMTAAFEGSGTNIGELKAALESVQAGGFQGGKSSDTGEFQHLNKYSIDLTQEAREGKFDPVIGRSSEIRQLLQILNRRHKNNPLLVGEPGVGKTAIVEGLAQRIVDGDVPDNLKNLVVLALDLGQLVAGTKFRGEFEKRFKNVMTEAIDAENVVLFIDEIHMIIGAGSSEGSMDASNLLKPALSRGQLRCIGATTISESRKRIEKDAALTRRFQLIKVEEPNTEAAINILRGLKEKYEVHHGVRILDAAITAAVKLSDRYLTDRFLPDKAIDLIDETASSLRMDISSKPAKIEECDREILQLSIEKTALEKEDNEKTLERRSEIEIALVTLSAKSSELTEIWQREKRAIFDVAQVKADLEAAKREMEQKIRDENFARVAELQYKIIPDREAALSEFEEVDLNNTQFLREAVGEEDVARALSRWTGIPVDKMLDSERERLLQMEALMRRRVIGQEEALTATAKALRRSRAGLQDPNRPIASFLMVGPTGVGKTELSKALAEFMFDDERALLRLDMSEYMEKHSVARLVGAPPGYVGHDEGGVLTNKIRRKPYSVLLFDEVEKAHPDVFNLLLQVLDDGRLTDSQGTTVDFTNTIIILTSNLGTRVISEFEGESSYEAMKDSVLEAVKGHFRPEFLNRLDDIIIFRSLGSESIGAIVDIQLNRLQERLNDRDIVLDINKEARTELARQGLSPTYGARPLKRVIQNKLADPLSEAILEGTIAPDYTVRVTCEDGELCLAPESNVPVEVEEDIEQEPEGIEQEPSDEIGVG